MQYSIAIQYCYSVLLFSIAIQYYYSLLYFLFHIIQKKIATDNASSDHPVNNRTTSLELQVIYLDQTSVLHYTILLGKLMCPFSELMHL